jgi:uncharacterized protein
MLELINPLNVTWYVWFMTLFVAFIAGVSKSGLKGLVMIGIPILAQLYGAKESTGIILPFLIFGDLFALREYSKSSNKGMVYKLFPYAIIGILGGTFAGNYLNNEQFTFAIASIILVCVGLIIYTEFKPIKGSIFDHPIVSPIFGLAGGFATMVGNLAGPIFSLYFLSMKLTKRQFIGTGALFYLFLNLFKVPFHCISWGTINRSSFQMNLVMLPAVYLGSIVGEKVVNYIPEKEYRYFILTVTAISAVLLYW